MSAWSGLDVEIDGIRSAHRNVGGDTERMARYVYGRACEYVGPAHEDVAALLIGAALHEAAKVNGTEGWIISEEIIGAGARGSMFRFVTKEPGFDGCEPATLVRRAPTPPTGEGET